MITSFLMPIPPTLSKSEIAKLYNIDLRTINKALRLAKEKYPWWFGKTRVFLPSQYKPILNHLESECGLEKALQLEQLNKSV